MARELKRERGSVCVCKCETERKKAFVFVIAAQVDLVRQD